MLEAKKILVVGDTMLDIYFNGEVSRISPEAPVPVFKKKSEFFVLGGAANVAANLAAANQKVSIMSLVGNDEYSIKMFELFSEIGINHSLVQYWDRPTITKTRFLAENNQQVLRLDIEDINSICKENENELLEKMGETIDQFDLLVLSDYMKGLLTPCFTQKIIKIAKEHGKKVLVDVKDPNFEKYKGAWLLKPNLKELSSMTKMPVSTDDELLAAGRYLLTQTESEYILTTCGAKGMVLIGRDTVYHLDTVSKDVYDVTGAGDTVIAYLSAAISNGIEIKKAMQIANYAAGIQVGKVGTSVVYAHEVEEVMKSEKQKKKNYRINERKELIDQIAEWKSQGKTIVTTNGCFDILHRGHITLLEQAKKYGDCLIVLVNSDASVRRLKGPNRPINSEEDRTMVISSISCVDAVAIFDPLLDKALISDEEFISFSDELKKAAAEAPMGILKQISPDVHVKGGDYKVEQVPEAKYARDFKTVPFVQGYSTTNTIQKSREQ